MAAATLPTGPAPRGFWKEGKAEELLASVMLALVSDEAIKEIDMFEVARIVGEGKVSEKSTKAKVIQIRDGGRQRISDSQIRLRADDENAVPHDLPRKQPTGRDGRRENAEPNDNSSQLDAESNDTNSPTTTSKSRKRNAADELVATTERQKKQKKKNADDLPDTTERQKKQKKKNDKRKEKRKSESRHKAKAATRHPALQSGSRLTSEEITPDSEGLLERQIADGNLVKREVVDRTVVRPNPALRSEGLCKKSAIVIEDSDSGDEVADEQPAEPRGHAARKTLPLQGTRGPLKPSKNGANVQKPSKTTEDKTGSKPQKQIWYHPNGTIRRTQVEYQSRSWQAPFQYEINM